MLKLKSILDEKFNDVLHQIGKDKNDWVDLSDNPERGLINKDLDAKQNIFNLVDLTYKTFLKEPHFGVKSVNDVLSNEYDYWEAIDINDNPEAEAVLFGKKRNGIKISGLGHDGEKISKKILTQKMVELTKQGNYWTEASGKPAQILRFFNSPILKDKEKITKLFPGSKIKVWNHDGSYVRELPDGRVTDVEMVFGNPQV